MPSRYEASFSCYDHFLNKLTLSGEPLGYLGAGLRAARQLASLLRGASWDTTLPCHLVGFSKGGVVLNQVLHADAKWLVVAMQLHQPRAWLVRWAAHASCGEPAIFVHQQDAFPTRTGLLLLQILVELAELAAGPAGQGRGGSPGGATPHLHQPPEAAEEGAIALLRSLQQIHFLDCGLNCRGAYLTDPEAVQRLGAWCRQHPQLRLFVHGTPRQWGERAPQPSTAWRGTAGECTASSTTTAAGALLQLWSVAHQACLLEQHHSRGGGTSQAPSSAPPRRPPALPADDPRRPWIPLEKNRFAALCAEAGVPLQQRKFCEGQRPSLEQHFRVVQDFAGVAGKSGR